MICSNQNCQKVFEGSLKGRRPGNRTYCSKPCQRCDYNQRYQNMNWHYKQYGLTVRDYNVRFQQQDGQCAVCGKTQSTRLHVDHCHKSGHLRELLCTKCNMGLGHFNDDTQLLQKALEYLKRHGGK